MKVSRRRVSDKKLVTEVVKAVFREGRSRTSVR